MNLLLWICLFTEYSYPLYNKSIMGIADVTKFTFAIDDIFGQKHLPATYGQRPKRPHEMIQRRRAPSLSLS